MSTLLGNSFSRFLAIFLHSHGFRSGFYLQNSTYFIQTKANFHGVRYDVVVTSSADYEPLSKYILEYSFAFSLVQEVLKSIKKHGRYSPKQSGIFLWTTMYVVCHAFRRCRCRWRGGAS